MAMSQVIARTTAKKEYIRLCWVLLAISVVWGVTACLVIGVGCKPSKPWDLVERCPDLVSYSSI